MSRDWRRDDDDEGGSKPPKPFNKRFPSAAPDLEPVMKLYLSDRGLSFDLARSNGWYASRAANPRYLVDGIPRVVIPATSHIQGNVYWQGRDMSGRDPKRYTSPGAPSGDAVVVIWPKERTHRSVVVEGAMDALAAAEIGYTGVALMGLPTTPEAISLTAYLVRGTMCSLVADSDAIPAMTQILLSLIEKRCSARLLEPSPFKDLAEAPPDDRRLILA
jgi:hypothetical protein